MSYFYTKNVAICCHPKLNSLAPKPGNFVPKAVEVMSVIDKFSVGFFLIEYTVSAWICYCMYTFTRYFNSQMLDVSLHTKATIIACRLIMRIDFSPIISQFLAWLTKTVEKSNCYVISSKWWSEWHFRHLGWRRTLMLILLRGFLLG